MSHYRYLKADNQFMKNYIENKESSYLMYSDVNNLYRWAMSQKLPVNDFKLVEDIFLFSKDFMESYKEGNNIGYYIGPDNQYTEK